MMQIEENTQSSETIDRPARPQARREPAADPVSTRLDVIVGRAQRRAPVRRALRRFADSFARWLDALVPPAPPAHDREPPPEIRFPFF
jgi:hypothetical protein